MFFCSFNILSIIILHLCKSYICVTYRFIQYVYITHSHFHMIPPHQSLSAFSLPFDTTRTSTRLYVSSIHCHHVCYIKHVFFDRPRVLPRILYIFQLPSDLYYVKRMKIAVLQTLHLRHFI